MSSFTGNLIFDRFKEIFSIFFINFVLFDLIKKLFIKSYLDITFPEGKLYVPIIFFFVKRVEY